MTPGERQREHALQLDSVFFAKPSELAKRWRCDVSSVLAIPRERLPYIEVGKRKLRRYNPKAVEAYETALEAAS